jgi:hypothetical protein
MTRSPQKKSQINADSLPQLLDNLVTQRRNWEAAEYASSNSILYSLLGKCLDLYTAIHADRALGKAFNEYLENRGLTTNGAASAQLRIVRAVFVSHNAACKHEARLLGYAKVIKVAADNDCTGKTFLAFINKHHGIEAIRRMPKKDDPAHKRMSRQEAREVANEALQAASAKTLFKSFDLPEDLAPQSDAPFSVALVRRDADGKGSVVFGTGNAAAVNSLLAFAGRQIAKDADHKTVEEMAIIQQQQSQAGLQAFEEELALT